ncbi:Uncharacterised protein [Mycobacterium tuberculosis]|nr:Uncharacterised protein [Mycobacterium tuberculosis]
MDAILVPLRYTVVFSAIRSGHLRQATMVSAFDSLCLAR